MTTPSVTNIFVSGTTADSAQVNTNFQDLLNALTDGNNDLSIAALTCSGTTTLNGSVNLGNAGADDLTISASLAGTLLLKTNDSSDIGSSTIGLQNIFLGGTGGTTAIKGAASITTYTMTLPGTAGVAGQQLLNSGSGALEWIAGQMATVAKSAAYVITDTDKVRTVLHTTGASDFDVTLPTAADNTNRIVTLKKVDSGAGIVTLKSDAAGETIDGVSGTTGVLLSYQYDIITVQSDGSDWHTLNFAATPIGPERASTTVGSSYSGRNTAALTDTLATLLSVALTPGTYIVSGTIEGYHQDAALKEIKFGWYINDVLVSLQPTTSSEQNQAIEITLPTIPVKINTATNVSIKAYVATLGSSWQDGAQEIFATKIGL